MYDGYGNFLLFHDELDLKERMLEVGVLIRACGDFEGLDDTYFRIGIRSHSENQEFIRRLAHVKNVEKEIIKSKKSLFFQKTVIFLTLSGIILL